MNNSDHENQIFPEMLEFIKTARTIKNQLKILSSLNLPESGDQIIKDVAVNLSESIAEYIEGGRKK